jgi:hypothetical protein
MLKHLLERIELDEEGIAARLFPYTSPSLITPEKEKLN